MICDDSAYCSVSLHHIRFPLTQRVRCSVHLSRPARDTHACMNPFLYIHCGVPGFRARLRLHRKRVRQTCVSAFVMQHTYSHRITHSLAFHIERESASEKCRVNVRCDRAVLCRSLCRLCAPHACK